MGEFEKDIKNIFEDAEFTPSDKVWQGVEKELTSKKRIALWINWKQYGMAAALILVLGIGYVLRDEIFGAKDQPAQPQKTEQLSEKQSDQPEQEPTEEEPNSENDINPPVKKQEPIQDLVKSDPLVNREQTLALNTVQTEKVDVSSQDTETSLISESQLDRDFKEISQVGLKDWQSVAGKLQWRNKYLVPSPDFNFEDRYGAELPEKNRELGLGGTIAAGSFNPDAGGAFSQEDAFAVIQNEGFDNLVDQASNTENVQEGSFSIGGAATFRLSKRWDYRTGISFSQYRFSNMANAYSVENNEQLPIYVPAGFNAESVFIVGPYNLRSTLSTISIPTIFSYRFINAGRFSTALNLGVGLDFIASYKISGDLNFLETRKVDLSESDEFNRFNINGLTGLEFGYRLNDKFGIGAEMFYRKYLTQSANDARNNTSPAFYGFGLSVNYFIKK